MDPALKLVVTSMRGRGLLATRALPAGSVLFEEMPVVAHRPQPPPVPLVKSSQRRRGGSRATAHSSKGSVNDEPLSTSCPQCYRPLADCKANPCLDPALPSTPRYLASLQDKPFRRLVSTFASKEERFPVLAARLALRCHFEETYDEPGSSALRNTINTLVAPSQTVGSDFPPDFVAAHTLASHLLKQILSPPESAQFLGSAAPTTVQTKTSEPPVDLPWFAGVLGRLHLNAMRTDPGSLSVLYALGSFFNHGCRENVAPEWHGATVKWTATRDIEAEEECLISYHAGGAGNADATSSVETPRARPESARDEFLW